MLFFTVIEGNAELALACLETRVGFVNDVQASFAAHKLAVAVTLFQGFKRTTDFHHSSLIKIRGESNVASRTSQVRYTVKITVILELYSGQKRR